MWSLQLPQALCESSVPVAYAFLTGIDLLVGVGCMYMPDADHSVSSSM